MSIKKIAALVFSLSVSNAYAGFVYKDFADVSDLQLNGDAIQSTNNLRLTSSTTWQSGSAFYTDSISLDDNASFSTAFDFLITESGGIGNPAGADGIVFTMNTIANNIGGTGGGIGYEGIPNSFGVEFDTYNNGGWDNNDGNHVGMNLNGSIDSFSQVSYPTPFNNGEYWQAWIDYNGDTDQLVIRLANGLGNNRSDASVLFSNTVDLVGVLGATDVFVGFTSGTGLGYGNHDITSWQFNSTYQPIDSINSIPDPSTLSIFSLVLAGLFYRKFWRS